MPPDRRRRRFRRPGTGRWLTETLPSLRIELASQVRATLTAWMRLYGEANNVPGLATGPIETRFARLRENTAADTLIVWTTPGRWAGGEGLSLRFPQLHLEFTCSLADGHLVATKVAQVPDDARPPDREAGAVGVIVHPEHVPLPPEDVDASEPDAGVDTLERHFAQLAGRRWGGFAAPLLAALDAEARDDEARTQRLTVPFKEGSLLHGGEEDVWRLKGISIDALRALDDGEWLEILDDQGRSRTSARVIATHPGAGTLMTGVRTAADPPRTGFVRPRSRKKILEQKRALLEELASPTGSLPNLVRLVAAPASMPTPRQVRPARFVNPAIMRNRSQSRAVSLALGLDEGHALLIQGPPGTGKSTTAAEIDVQLILRDPGVRILVCSHSNHGTDNMLMKVLPFLEDAQERIARIGFFERIAKEARPFYAAADTDLGEKNIIFTTIDALVLQDAAGARVYDYVLLDEANRAGVLDSLLALARGKRMILVGDPMQLQPVMSEAEQQMVTASANAAIAANGGGRRGRGRRSAAPVVGVALPGANNVIGKSLFAWIQERRFAPPSTVLLDQQNRMHPAIGELVSRVFYANRVRTGPAAPRRGTGLPAFPSPVSWVDTRALRGNVESRAGGTSLFNVAEARLVTSITRHLASQAPPNLTIGVITAYAEQRDLLRRLMGPHDWATDRQLEIDTVDAFEGREKDIIVLSLVRANRRRDIGFLRLEQRLNVAVSRSRRLIIIVGDTSTLRGGYFNHLVSTAQSVGQIIPAPKLIGQFLSRGGPTRRPRHERDELRREAGLGRPETEDLAAATGELDGASGELVAEAGSPQKHGVASGAEPGDGRPGREHGVAPRAESGDGGAAREHGVAPAAAPGQESPSAGSRRRRRRAWERRRERLRNLQEGQAAEQRAAGGDVQSEGPAGADWHGETTAGAESHGETAAGADARGAAPAGGAESLGETAAGADSRSERAVGGDSTSAVRGPAEIERRPRRRRRFGIPRDDEPQPAPAPQAEHLAEARATPLEGAAPAPAPEQPVANGVTPAPQPAKARTPRRRAVMATTDVSAPPLATAAIDATAAAETSPQLTARARGKRAASAPTPAIATMEATAPPKPRALPKRAARVPTEVSAPLLASAQRLASITRKRSPAASAPAGASAEVSAPTPATASRKRAAAASAEVSAPTPATASRKRVAGASAEVSAPTPAQPAADEAQPVADEAQPAPARRPQARRVASDSPS